MRMDEKELELRAAMDAAVRMCAAARTAPKACGIDRLHTMILTGADKDALSAELRRLSETQNIPFYGRDAGNLDASLAVVLIGTEEAQRGLGEGCGYCHMGSCEGCLEKNGVCVFDPMDLGIALGSAAATAADLRVDTRIMYSIGKAALS